MHVQVEGDFHSQDAVSLCDATGTEFARGLVNFDSTELKRVKVRLAQGCGAPAALGSQSERRVQRRASCGARGASAHVVGWRGQQVRGPRTRVASVPQPAEASQRA